MDELGRVSPEGFREQAKTPIVLVLDNLRSALNVGSAFRTADAFALQKVWLCGITATPPHREILKTALGATDTVEWEYEAHVEKVITHLKSSGYVVLSVEQTDGSQSLLGFEADPSKRYALVFGNEVDGVSQAAIAGSDGCLEVPQEGTKHSLNVAVCVGIVTWHFYFGLKRPA